MKNEKIMCLTRSYLFSKNSCKIFRPLNIHCTTFVVLPHCGGGGQETSCNNRLMDEWESNYLL